MQPNYSPIPPTPVLPGSGGSNRKLIFLLVILLLLFFISVFFGFWAYGNMMDYKNNVDKKITVATQIAKQQTSSEKDKAFIEKEKSPYRQYKGPETYGSVKLQYPKTWSVYVDTNASSGSPLDSYFQPDFVPSVQAGSAYALRIQVNSQSYDTNLSQLTAQNDTKNVSVAPYRVNGVLGSILTGEVNQGQSDIMVLLPLRDKTLEIWTESKAYAGDFNNIILPSFSFSP